MGIVNSLKELSLKSLFIFSFLFLFSGSIFATVLWYSPALVSEEHIMNRNDMGIILLDRNGLPFFSFYKYKRMPNMVIPLSKIPVYTQEAFIAAEDRDFYFHNGISPRGIIRSVFRDATKGQLQYGGSTITQQLVKNALLNSQKTFLRKYQELILASAIEYKYSKDQILYMYLNSVYFGEGAVGVQQASLTYFHKNAQELNLAESAFLAGILPAPSQMSPFSGNLSLAKTRQQYVLDEMVKAGFISVVQKHQALAQKLSFKKTEDNMNAIAPHFALLVRDILVNKYGEETVARSGFIVKTTLDTKWQRYAEEVTKKQLLALNNSTVTNAAVVVMDPKNGEVRVMVGSKNWSDDKFGKVNMAIAPRQPGSSFKPIVYSLAMEERKITPATVLIDKPTTFSDGYTPKNYDGQFRGPVTVRRALSNSLNVPSVAVMEKVGVPPVLDFAQRLGVTTINTNNYYGPSIVLGTIEVPLIQMTGVYATFANEGKTHTPATILEIKNKYNEVVYTYNPVPEDVLDPRVAFLISSILSDRQSRREEFGSALDTFTPAAVKTGTSENFRDALTFGYTPFVTIGVWAGNNDNTPMRGVSGVMGAAPIYRELMDHFMSGIAFSGFYAPEGVVRAPACGFGSKTATASASMDFFLQGTKPDCYIAQTDFPPVPNLSVTPTISPIPSSSIDNVSPTLAPSVSPTPTQTGATIFTGIKQPEGKKQKQD